MMLLFPFFFIFFVSVLLSTICQGISRLNMISSNDISKKVIEETCERGIDVYMIIHPKRWRSNPLSGKNKQLETNCLYETVWKLFKNFTRKTLTLWIIR